MSDDKLAERATAYIAQQREQFTDGFSAIHTAHLRLQAALDVAIKERDEARAEVERMRGERDTLLLDARDFLRWFNRHYPEPSGHPDHPWCAISSRLDAYAGTLKTFDSGVETKEAKP